MGIYLNPNNTEFYNAVEHSKIYVDKTELIAFTNSVLFGEHRNICVSRPRRFGKSMAANMLVAYYSCGCDSRGLFDNLKISHTSNYTEHLNKYDVIHVNMLDEYNAAHTVSEMVEALKNKILWELHEKYGSLRCYDWSDLVMVMKTIHSKLGHQFIIIIDEWDCIFRENPHDKVVQEQFLDFLRLWLKDKSYVALSYMTGILPIKKYGKHSALNMFDEYSMTNQRELAEYTGFTEEEVRDLCESHDMPYEEMKKWYDGYDLKGISVYNPRSVVMSITGHDFDNYWTQTETYESVRTYIEMNYDGLRDTIIELIAGERKRIDTTTFTNDMVTFEIQDDVLTLLIHLGYLGYDFNSKEIFIPNYEIREQFISTVRAMGWNDIVKSLQVSDELLNATIQMNESKVAEIVELVHQENTSILQYNNENSLSCVLSLAYYSAKRSYDMYRELAGGKGFADLVFVPKKNCQSAAFIVELKWDKSAETAIDQIRDREYADCLKSYKGDIILVGLNYDKINKKHECKIEKIKK